MRCAQRGETIEENSCWEWKQRKLCDDCYLKLVFLAPKENSWRKIQDQDAKPYP